MLSFFEDLSPRITLNFRTLYGAAQKHAPLKKKTFAG